MLTKVQAQQASRFQRLQELLYALLLQHVDTNTILASSDRCDHQMIAVFIKQWCLRICF